MSTAKVKDPTLAEVLAIVERSGRSAAEIDRAKGVAPSTLRSWKLGKVRRPMNLSLEMTLRACGYKRIIVRDKGG